MLLLLHFLQWSYSLHVIVFPSMHLRKRKKNHSNKMPFNKQEMHVSVSIDHHKNNPALNSHKSVFNISIEMCKDYMFSWIYFFSSKTNEKTKTTFVHSIIFLCKSASLTFIFILDVSRNRMCCPPFAMIGKASRHLLIHLKATGVHSCCRGRTVNAKMKTKLIVRMRRTYSQQQHIYTIHELPRCH